MGLKPKTGDCDFCPASGVEIVSGKSTRNKKRCRQCELKRRLNKAKTAAKMRPQRKITQQLSVETVRQKEKKRGLAELKTMLIDTKGCICEECGAVRTRSTIDLSHLLSQGARPELALEPENVVLHCKGLDRCHTKWENGTVEYKMQTETFRKHAGYIRQYSTKYQ